MKFCNLVRHKHIFAVCHKVFSFTSICW